MSYIEEDQMTNFVFKASNQKTYRLINLIVDSPLSNIALIYCDEDIVTPFAIVRNLFQNSNGEYTWAYGKYFSLFIPAEQEFHKKLHQI